MKIALCGAHRTGKTTIAQSLAKHYGIDYVPSQASAVAARMGINLKGQISVADRIAYQQAVMKTMVEDWTRDTPFITDRTPLDAAAYLLADMANITGSNKERRQVVSYVEKAQVLTGKLFDILIYVPPAIEYHDEPGKPPFNEAYQEHHGFLVLGMFYDNELATTYKLHIDRKLADHSQRVGILRNEIDAIRSTL